MNIIKNGDYISAAEEFVSEIQKEKLIYEVIRIIEGIPLFLEDHLNRLNNSLSIIKEKEINEDMLKTSINALIDKSHIYNGNIKIIYDYKNINIYIMEISHSYPEMDEYKYGVKTILYFGERNNPNAKVMDVNFRANVNKKIKENNVYEAILVNNLGFITEGSKSNIFLIKGDNLYTSPNKEVLPGITRENIISICKDNKINVFEKDISYKDLNSFDALFISGTSPKILPIKSVDDILFNSAHNDLLTKLKGYYDFAITEYINNRK